MDPPRRKITCFLSSLLLGGVESRGVKFMRATFSNLTGCSLDLNCVVWKAGLSFSFGCTSGCTFTLGDLVCEVCLGWTQVVIFLLEMFLNRRDWCSWTCCCCWSSSFRLISFWSSSCCFSFLFFSSISSNFIWSIRFFP